MPEWTQDEMVRTLQAHERGLDTKVSKELYERDLRDIRDRITGVRQEVDNLRKDFEDFSTRFTWLIIGQFFALIVGLLFFVLGRP